MNAEHSVVRCPAVIAHCPLERPQEHLPRRKIETVLVACILSLLETDRGKLHSKSMAIQWFRVRHFCRVLRHKIQVARVKLAGGHAAAGEVREGVLQEE